MKKRVNMKFLLASLFGCMLVFNVMLGLQFNEGKIIPKITIINTGNQAFAQSELEGANTVDCYSSATENFTADYYDCSDCSKKDGIAQGTKKTCKFKPGFE